MAAARFGWRVELLGVEHPVSGCCVPVFHRGFAAYSPAIGFEMIEKLSGFDFGKTFYPEISNDLFEFGRLHYLFFFLRNFFSFGFIEIADGLFICLHGFRI